MEKEEKGEKGYLESHINSPARTKARPKAMAVVAENGEKGEQ